MKLAVVRMCGCDEDRCCDEEGFHREGPRCDDDAPGFWAVTADELDLDAPRVAYETYALACTGLAVLQGYDDAFLRRMFTRRARRFL